MKIPEMLCEMSVVSEEMEKEENRSQLGPMATRGGLGTIHRN